MGGRKIGDDAFVNPGDLWLLDSVNGLFVRLDHIATPGIAVIQIKTKCVFSGMMLAIPTAVRSFAGLPLPRRPADRAKPHVRGYLREVSLDRVAMTDRSDWSRLIWAIAQRQDRAAFAALFTHFAPRVKAFLLRSGASDAGAEEIAQETMLMVWRKAALFDPESRGAAAWIFTIARNLRIDARRRELRGGMIAASDSELEFQVDEGPAPDAQLSTFQTEDRIRTALQELSYEQMQVIELSYFEEKPHAEISKILNIPLGTVKSRLRLATGKLRSLLSDEHED